MFNFSSFLAKYAEITSTEALQALSAVSSRLSTLKSSLDSLPISYADAYKNIQTLAYDNNTGDVEDQTSSDRQTTSSSLVVTARKKVEEFKRALISYKNAFLTAIKSSVTSINPSLPFNEFNPGAMTDVGFGFIVYSYKDDSYYFIPNSVFPGWSNIAFETAATSMPTTVRYRLNFGGDEYSEDGPEAFYYDTFHCGRYDFSLGVLYTGSSVIFVIYLYKWNGSKWIYVKLYSHTYDKNPHTVVGDPVLINPDWSQAADSTQPSTSNLLNPYRILSDDPDLALTGSTSTGNSEEKWITRVHNQGSGDVPTSYIYPHSPVSVPGDTYDMILGITDDDCDQLIQALSV